MTTWPSVALGDLLHIKHGFAFKGEHFVSAGEQLVLTPGNFKVGGGLQLRDGKERYYSGPYPDEFTLDPGALLIAMTDLTQSAPILGSPLVVPAEGVFLHNQRLGRVTVVDEQRLDRGFAYYLFVSDIVRSQLRATATGATVRHTAPGRVYSTTVALPPVLAQRKIVGILSAYDDQIGNNTRRIQILEEMAQRIYSEWFVEFRYPGHEDVPLVDAALGPIPKGWAWRYLMDLADEIRAGVDPATVAPSTPYVGLEHMPEHSIAISDWGTAVDAGSRKLRFNSGDILFGKIRPYFHKVAVPPVDGICSTDAIVIRAADPFYGLVLALTTSDAFVQHAVQTSQGTKMPRANWAVLERYPLPVPSVPELGKFDSLIADVVAAIHRMVMSNRNLRTTRDLLLPVLLSGQVDVADLDIALVEDAA